MNRSSPHPSCQTGHQQNSRHRLRCFKLIRRKRPATRGAAHRIAHSQGRGAETATRSLDRSGMPAQDCATHTTARHIRNLFCPVTSRTRARLSIHASLRWTAARLAPVTASAMGAGQLASAERSRAGVRPERPDIAASARPAHTSIWSRCRQAVGIPLSIPSSHCASRAAGSPPARRPLPSPKVNGARPPRALRLRRFARPSPQPPADHPSDQDRPGTRCETPCRSG